MEENYLLAYTIFCSCFKNGFKSFYRHFEKLEDMEHYIKNHGIENCCIRYKKIEK